jgi:RES domain-containing protein
VVAYCSGSLSLAALEVLVHVDPHDLPADLVAIEVDIPDSVSIEELDPSVLPLDWRDFPAPVQLQDLGSAWVKAVRTAVLTVPSAVIPEERTYLVNPAHPEAKRITAAPPRPFVLDPRLLP